MKLIIPASIERKLNAYVQGVNVEIAGMGAVEKREDGNLWVTDIAIYDQEVTGGTADLSSEALAYFLTDLVKKGISPKNWYLWWHSHVNMQAYFSGIDTATIDGSTEFDHLLSLVVNKRRERKCRLDVFKPAHIFLDNIEVEVVPEITAETIEIDEQIREKMLEIKELQNQKSEIQNVEPEGIAEEIKEKVRIKHFHRTTAPIGFKPKGPSKQPGDRSYQTQPLDPNWSKKRKKDGTVSTVGQIIVESALDIDEVELLIEETKTMIKTHEANGNGDEVACEELRADLETYEGYLEFLLTEQGEDNYEDQYWNGYMYVNRRQSGYFGDDDDDDYGLPPLAAPYRYTLGSGRDNERE